MAEKGLASSKCLRFQLVFIAEPASLYLTQSSFQKIEFLVLCLKLRRDMRFPTICMCHQQSLRSACAYAQSDQRLC